MPVSGLSNASLPCSRCLLGWRSLLCTAKFKQLFRIFTSKADNVTRGWFLTRLITSLSRCAVCLLLCRTLRNKQFRCSSVKVMFYFHLRAWNIKTFFPFIYRRSFYADKFVLCFLGILTSVTAPTACGGSAFLVPAFSCSIVNSKSHGCFVREFPKVYTGSPLNAEQTKNENNSPC